MEHGEAAARQRSVAQVQRLFLWHFCVLGSLYISAYLQVTGARGRPLSGMSWPLIVAVAGSLWQRRRWLQVNLWQLSFCSSAPVVELLEAQMLATGMLARDLYMMICAIYISLVQQRGPNLHRGAHADKK
jgi:hypothetical protein